MAIDKNYLRLIHILDSIIKLEKITQELSYVQYLEDLDKAGCNYQKL
mgnify:CR=1 FL=1